MNKNHIKTFGQFVNENKSIFEEDSPLSAAAAAAAKTAVAASAAAKTDTPPLSVESIKTLQKRFGVTVTGKLDTATINALKKWQTASKLPATGKLDPLTVKKLKEKGPQTGPKYGKAGGKSPVSKTPIR